jgi:hypothetical protein
MSGIRISEFKKPRTIIVDQAKVESAYGPKSSIQLETTASSFSKSGFTIEVKGLSRDSLLNGLFCVIPVQVKWQALSGNKILPNGYPEMQARQQYVGAGAVGARAFVMTGDQTADPAAKSNLPVEAPAMACYDNICIRPNPFKCIRNATLSINGSSFSTRTDSYYTAMSKLFADGRVEPISGAAYERYPYTNSGYKSRIGAQDGWFERCRSQESQGKIISAAYSGGHQLESVVIEYDLKFPIWFGPFTHLGFPGLSGFDGQSVSSLPYCNDLVFEATFTDDVLMDAFSCSDDARDNALGVANPEWMARGVAAATDFMPDTRTMWAACKTDDTDLTNAEANLVSLRQPRLCYTFSEPDPDKMDIAPIYTLPSYRLITYEQRVAIAANSLLADFKFPYIRLSNISSLYIVHAEQARVGAGEVAGRQARRVGAWNAQHLGMSCANRTCPIKWDTVRVSMSTSSSVLANFLSNYVTAQNQFELFKKYSGNAMALTFNQWKESSQMLIFSAEELCGIGAFANSFQSLTLSVEFSCYRDASDTKLQFRDYLIQDEVANSAWLGKNGKKGQHLGTTLIGRLICLEPELVSISEGAVSVEQVKLSQAEIHAQLMGGAPEVEDAPKLDELAR